jgi:predicted heme/steroid binding protein
MKEFTKDELSKYNGKNGAPTYFALKGKVYDVSKNELWADGEHMWMHNAGQDLTEFFGKAPHDEGILERYLLVGTLKKD